MFERKEDQTLRKVHEENVKAAQKMGLTLKAWHDLMSSIGNALPSAQGTVVKSDDEIARESARWIGGYHARQLSGIFIKKKK